jgi:hypothetical protein
MIGCMPGYKLPQSPAVHLTPGDFELRHEALGLLEHVIGDGYSGLHTLSITSADRFRRSVTVPKRASMKTRRSLRHGKAAPDLSMELGGTAKPAMEL